MTLAITDKLYIVYNATRGYRLTRERYTATSVKPLITDEEESVR